MISSYIPLEGVNYFQHIKQKLNNLYGNEDWQKAYDDAIEPIKNTFYNKIYQSFKNKYFNKTVTKNQNSQLPFPISWMLNFINNYPYDINKDNR